MTFSENWTLSDSFPLSCLVAVTVTVWFSTGPSVASYDQDQVPLESPLLVTCPMDAVMSMMLAFGSSAFES